MVEHTLGKGGVGSSILLGGTRFAEKNNKAFICMKLIQKYQNLIGILLVIFFILISSQKFYFNAENLGYWYFAKEFLYNFDFVIRDRSPLYTVYLSPIILLLDYPYNLYFEYIVNRLILFLSFFLLFKDYINKKYLFIIFIIWIPFFNVVIPEPQILALSLLNIAFYMRYKKNYNLLFYLLLFVAYLVRQVFIIPLVLFIFFDTILVIREKFKKISLKKISIFIFIILSIFITISHNQSKSTYNNFNFIDTKYLPTSFKSSLNGGFIQTYLHNYYDDGFSKSKNRELKNISDTDFPNSNNFFQFITANPLYFFIHLKNNIIDLSESYSRAFKNNLKQNYTNIFLLLLIITTLIFERKKINIKKIYLKDYRYVLGGFSISILLLMFSYFSISFMFFFLFICIYHSYKVSLSLFLFVISIISMDMLTVLSQPQERYLFGMMSLITIIITYLIYEINKFTSSKYVLFFFIIAFTIIFSPSQKYILDSKSPYTWLEFILKPKDNIFYGEDKNLVTAMLKDNCPKILSRNGHFFNSFYDYDINNVIFVSSINPNLKSFDNSDILIDQVNCIYNYNDLKKNSSLALQNYINKKIIKDYTVLRVYNGELIIFK